VKSADGRRRASLEWSERLSQFREFPRLHETIRKSGQKGNESPHPACVGTGEVLPQPGGRWLVIGASIAFILALGVFIHFYATYAQLMDEKLRLGPFANTAKIFAGPQSVAVGDALTPEDIAADLRAAATANRVPTRTATISFIRTRSRFSPGRIPISTRRRG